MFFYNSKTHLDKPGEIKVVDIGYKYMNKNYHPDRDIETFESNNGCKVTYKIYRHRPILVTECPHSNYKIMVTRYSTMRAAMDGFNKAKEMCCK